MGILAESPANLALSEEPQKLSNDGWEPNKPLQLTFWIRQALFESGGIHIYRLLTVTHEQLKPLSPDSGSEAVVPYPTETLTNDCPLTRTTQNRHRWLSENACIQILKIAN